MKCISCGNIIPDNSTVCSYCNTPVNTGVSVIPQTPTVPVLPQDQNMQTGNLKPAEPIDTYVNPEVQAIPNVSNVAPVQPQVAVPSGTPEQSQVAVPSAVPVQPQVAVPSAAPVQPQIAVPSAVPVQPQVAVPSAVPVQPQVAVPSASIVQPQVVVPSAPIESSNNISESYIDPNGAITGEKIGSTAVKTKKKMSKKTKIILIVVLVVILISGGAGGYYYYSQYKTTDKRLTAVVNGVTSFINSYTNDTIEKSSSSYVADVSLSSGENNYVSNVKGSYARDLSSKKFDFLFDIESLTNNGEEQISSPLNFEFYLSNANMYVLFENFTETYMFEPETSYDDILTNIEQNDINYTSVISGVKLAFISGVKSMTSSTSVESITYNGKSVHANDIKIILSKFNQERFINAFVNNIKNNSTLLDEFAKIYGVDVDEYTKTLDDLVNNFNYVDNNTTVDIYTKMFGSEFYGINVDYYSFDDSSDHYVLNLYKSGTGYGLSIDDDSRNIFNGSYTKTVTNTATTKESNYVVEFTTFKNDEATSSNINLTLTTDVKPKDASVVVRNSLQKEYVNEETKNQILTSALNVGPFGVELNERINKYFKYDYKAFITNKDDEEVEDAVDNTTDENIDSSVVDENTTVDATTDTTTQTDTNTCSVDQMCN